MKYENQFHGIFIPEYFSNYWKFDLTKCFFLSFAIGAKGYVIKNRICFDPLCWGMYMRVQRREKNVSLS